MLMAHGVGVPARAHGAAAALALRHPRRRRPAERGAEHGEHLVLLPRARLREDAGDVRGRQEDGAGRGADDRHADRHDHDGRLGLERALLAARSPRRCTRTSRRSGMPTWDEKDQTLAKALQRELGVARQRPQPCARPPRRPGGRGDAHGRRLGRHRRRELERADDHAALSRRTSRARRGTTGRTRSRWRRRSRTRASSPARRCRR